MHKCEYPGCQVKIKNKYKFCFEHRFTEYEDFCRIHGKTLHINGKCIDCEQMKIPIYNVYKKGKKYYNFYGQQIPKYDDINYERLVILDKKYHARFVRRITEGPGIYGIFVRDRRTKLKIGKCLYIGQSIDVKSRVKQHKDCFRIAKRHLNGIKLHKKRIYLNKINYKTEYKYYKMAKDYNLPQLKFVKLVSLPKDFINSTHFKEIITYFEQSMINVYNPILNTYAARPILNEKKLDE